MISNQTKLLKEIFRTLKDRNRLIYVLPISPTGSDLFVAYYCPLLSVSKTHKKHEARPGFFRHSTLFYYVIVIAEMIDDEKRTFFIHGSYTFAISQSYIKQCTNFQSQLLFDAFTYDLGVSS